MQHLFFSFFYFYFYNWNVRTNEPAKDRMQFCLHSRRAKKPSSKNSFQVSVWFELKLELNLFRQNVELTRQLGVLYLLPVMLVWLALKRWITLLGKTWTLRYHLAEVIVAFLSSASSISDRKVRFSNLPKLSPLKSSWAINGLNVTEIMLN